MRLLFQALIVYQRQSPIRACLLWDWLPLRWVGLACQDIHRSVTVTGASSQVRLGYFSFTKLYQVDSEEQGCCWIMASPNPYVQSVGIALVLKQVRISRAQRVPTVFRRAMMLARDRVSGSSQ